jgi:hypothetical protein
MKRLVFLLSGLLLLGCSYVMGTYWMRCWSAFMCNVKYSLLYMDTSLVSSICSLPYVYIFGVELMTSGSKPKPLWNI